MTSSIPFSTWPFALITHDTFLNLWSYVKFHIKLSFKFYCIISLGYLPTTKFYKRLESSNHAIITWFCAFAWGHACKMKNERVHTQSIHCVGHICFSIPWQRHFYCNKNSSRSPISLPSFNWFLLSTRDILVLETHYSSIYN